MPLVLQPNAAVVANLRRKTVGDEDIAGAKGHAAGILFVAPDGDVLLLRRGKDEKNFASHWALPGGNVEAGEAPEEGAFREAIEEMGPDVPRGHRKLIDQTVTPTGMVFHTFAQPVEEKFAPKLNGESSGFNWSPLSALPSPMHPAVQGTLNTRLGLASDMSPEDWEGMVGGLLKFLAEEAQESEHAEDKSGELEHEIALQTRGDFDWKGLLHHMHSLGSIGASRDIIAMDSDDKPVRFNWDGDGADKIVNATVDGENILTRKALSEFAEDAALALDRESVRTKDIDGRLHVADVPLCRESVDPYKGSEIPGYRKLGLDAEKIYHLWRPADELEKALPTIGGIPVLRKHVATSAEDHKGRDTIGAVGTNARWEAPFIVGEIVIWPAEDIKGIESKEKYNLSPGYRYEPLMEVGDFNGTAFDGKMTKIVFNHLAVVENGRQAEVAIDSVEELRWAKIERALLAI
jgi:ADP-ribose pyrophosphatase YjhB (NUDIX family)